MSNHPNSARGGPARGFSRGRFPTRAPGYIAGVVSGQSEPNREAVQAQINLELVLLDGRILAGLFGDAIINRSVYQVIIRARPTDEARQEGIFKYLAALEWTKIQVWEQLR